MRERTDAAAEIIEGEVDPLLAQSAHEGCDGAKVCACRLLRKFEAQGPGRDAARAHEFLQHAPEFAVPERRRGEIQGKSRGMLEQLFAAGGEPLDRLFD